MSSDSKRASLREEGTLNPHPHAVADPLFQGSSFFDSQDIVQVKYEMLRRVRVDRVPVSRVVSDFGVSRPTWYEAQANFERSGVAGLVPRKRGPRGAHKVTEEILAFLDASVTPGEPLRAVDLARKVEETFGLVVHPRTIERALGAREKKLP